MKNLLIILITLTATITAHAQKSSIEFHETSHYLGNIPELEGEVKHTFLYKNTGNFPLTISEVRTGCKCTTCEWEEKTIAPGETGNLTVIFDPEGQPGKFIKSVAIFANTSPSVSTLTVRGYVIPQKSGPFGNFPTKLGDIRVSANTINIDGVNRGVIRHKEIEIINSSKESIELTTSSSSKNYTTSITPSSLAPLEKGKLALKWIVTDKEPLGPQTQEINIIVNGKECGKVITHAEVYENFSIYENEDYSMAPRICINESIFDMGELLANTIITHDISIRNEGINELAISKVICEDSNINVQIKKGIKSGKARKMVISLKTPAEPQEKESVIKLYTNDPLNPVINYKLKYRVLP